MKWSRVGVQRFCNNRTDIREIREITTLGWTFNSTNSFDDLLLIEKCHEVVYFFDKIPSCFFSVFIVFLLCNMNICLDLISSHTVSNLLAIRVTFSRGNCFVVCASWSTQLRERSPSVQADPLARHLL